MNSVLDIIRNEEKHILFIYWNNDAEKSYPIVLRYMVAFIIASKPSAKARCGGAGAGGKT